MSVLIVSELGINHNGNIKLAKEMIKASKEAGADLVKFQKRSIERVYSREELEKPREHPLSEDQTTRGQKKALEFGREEYDEIDRYCKHLDIGWLASAWDVESQLFLRKYDCQYNKIASAMLGHEVLLNTIAEERKMTFISTGMSTMEEIDVAVRIFSHHDCPFVLVHTNSTYPCQDDKLNLNCINTLRNNYGCQVGYSCHSPGIIPAIAAVTMGVCFIEKHFTLDRTMYGSDQASSVEPNGFRKMVEYIRTVEKALGDGKKTIHPEEEKVRAKLRRIKDY